MHNVTTVDKICLMCSRSFTTLMTYVKRKQGKFCSNRCSRAHNNITSSLKRKNKAIDIAHCTTCKGSMPKYIKGGVLRKFCSRSCSAIYNNKHKKYGTRRSKVEIWLESKLSLIYPDLKIEYNAKSAIGSELDIYIPSLKLAIELNGVFHYEPIFGKDKLGKIQSNDQNKFQACQRLGISLCIIDISQQTYFKESSSFKYLNIITEIISQVLPTTNSLEG